LFISTSTAYKLWNSSTATALFFTPFAGLAGLLVLGYTRNSAINTCDS